MRGKQEGMLWGGGPREALQDGRRASAPDTEKEEEKPTCSTGTVNKAHSYELGQAGICDSFFPVPPLKSLLVWRVGGGAPNKVATGGWWFFRDSLFFMPRGDGHRWSHPPRGVCSSVARPRNAGDNPGLRAGQSQHFGLADENSESI